MTTWRTYLPVRSKWTEVEWDDGSLSSDRSRGWMAVGETSPSYVEPMAGWRLAARNASEEFLSKRSCYLTLLDNSRQNTWLWSAFPSCTAKGFVCCPGSSQWRVNFLQWLREYGSGCALEIIPYHLKSLPEAVRKGFSVWVKWWDGFHHIPMDLVNKIATSKKETQLSKELWVFGGCIFQRTARL